MANDIRMILTDLDGTLLSSDHTVSPANRQAILDARAAGIETAFATGRLDLLVRDYVSKLGVTLPVVSCNGALIRDCATEQVVYAKTFPVGSAVGILRICLELGIDCQAYTPIGVWVPRYSRRIEFFHEYNRLAAAGGTRAVELHYLEDQDLESLAGIGIFKVFLARLHAGDIEQAIGRIQKCIPDVEFTNSVGDSRDVMSAGTTKGAALRILAAHAGLDPSQVAAFGDNDNDISMFESAGLSVAMGNSKAEVKSAAMHVTASNDEDGFAKAVYRYILGKA